MEQSVAYNGLTTLNLWALALDEEERKK